MPHRQPQPCPGSCCDSSDCGGSITVDGCFLSWDTTGSPFAVELRADTAVISTNPSGELNEPSEQTYSLWVQCLETDEFVEVDSAYYTPPAPGYCSTCCEALGYQGSTGSIVVPVVITITGHDVFALFNGTYSLLVDLCRCQFSDAVAFDAFDYDTCGTVDTGEFCDFNASLFAGGVYAGTRIFSFTGLPTDEYEVYAFPYQIAIDWKVPNTSEDCGGGAGFDNSIDVVLTIRFVGFRTSESNGMNVPCCVPFGECQFHVPVILPECGATSACTPYSGTLSDCPLIVPDYYEGYDISGTFDPEDFISFTLCANLVR